MTDTPLAPSDAERAEWSDRTREYVDYLEGWISAPDLTNPGNIPFGELPRATKEAMVIAHVLDGAKINALEPVDGELMWLPLTFCKWFPKRIYRVVQP